MHELNQKTVLIIGAGSGVGQQIAIDFANQGAICLLVGRDETNLAKTQALIAHGQTDIIPTDIRQETAVKTMMDKIIAKHVTLDIAINCAGVVRTGLINEMVTADFDLMLDTNVKGIWLAMKYQLIQMKKQYSGTIINISANIGIHQIRPELGGYAASKAALTVLTKTAALEALDFNVRVHAISPGPLDTPLSYRFREDKIARDKRISQTNPSKRVGRLEEISQIAQWLYTSPDYMVGQDIVVDGGASI